MTRPMTTPRKGNAEMSSSTAKRHGRAPRLIAALLCLAASAVHAADDPAAPKGATVTVLKANRACFAAIVEVSGILIAKDEISVRPDRPNLKVTDVLVDPGETVTAGQPLAKLALAEGGTTTVQAPAAGLISSSTATIGAVASPKGEALFGIITKSEFDLVGLVPTQDLAKLSIDQTATIKVIGAGDIQGRVRRISATVEPNSQLGQVFIALDANRRLLVNASGRAMIKTGQSCNVSVPLTSVLYGTSGTVVQVVRRDRVETRRVEVGLMSGGQIEIKEGLTEGDIVVARAGAMLREGDPVRAVMATAETAKN